MWSRIFYEGKNYLLRCKRENDDFTILLTDCSQLWTHHLSYLDLIQRCKDLNPLIEAKDDKYVSLVLDMFKTQNADIALVTVNVSLKLLRMKSKVCGFLFNFEIDLSAADGQVFQTEVMKPLLFLIHEMQWRNKILIDLLKKKDVEIMQYQLEGAQLFRSSVVTKPFQECEFEEERASVSIEKNICQEPLAVMVDDVLKLWGSVENKITDISKENIKTEPSSLPTQDEIGFEPPQIDMGEDTEVKLQNNLVDPVVNSIKEEKEDKSFEVRSKKRKKTTKKLLNL